MRWSTVCGEILSSAAISLETMLVDEAQAVELAGAEARNALGHVPICHLSCSSLVIIRRAVQVFQGSPHPAQHVATPERRV